jgi:hypothetical protein
MVSIRRRQRPKRVVSRRLGAVREGEDGAWSFDLNGLQSFATCTWKTTRIFVLALFAWYTVCVLDGSSGTVRKDAEP